MDLRFLITGFRLRTITKFILMVLILLIANLKGFCETESVILCPLCDKDGKIICPSGYEAACQDEAPSEGKTEPKCLILGRKYMPGCWKFVGVKKLDLDFSGLMLSPTSMIEIIGGGETYTLNRDIIGCKKL